MRDCTKIVMILDRSGSMSAVKDTMEEVLNGYVANQKEQPGECYFSLVQFDDRYEKVCTNLPIQDVQTIYLQPRGSTALLDAIGQTIDDVGVELSNMAEHSRPNKVLFVIITDGFENASYKYITKSPDNFNAVYPKSKRINDMVSHQRNVYKWEFIFLGADQDAITSAAGMGMSSTLAVNYDHTPAGIKGVGTRICKMSNMYRSAASASIGSEAIGFVNRENNQNVSVKDTLDWDEMTEKSKDKINSTSSK